jgi:hypothetical protein
MSETSQSNGVTAVTPMPSRRNVTVTPGPLDIVQAALKSGSVEIYREAVALYKELEAMAARKAFDNAMADAVFPIVKKDRLVDYPSAKSPNGRVTYKHEDLASVLRAVVPILSANGLSHRFRVTSEINQPVTVTCIISHRDGYFEETTLAAAKDDTGGKNAIQQVGSTLTYLQRMTLKAALGLAAAEDDDGQASGLAGGQAAAGEFPGDKYLTDGEIVELRRILAEVGCSEANFLRAVKCERVEDIFAASYDRCVKLIIGYKGPRQ